MVNEVSAGGRAKPPGSGNDGSSNPSQAESCVHPTAATSFTDPGKLDGVLPVSGAPLLAVDLLHRSAQGGWGRRLIVETARTKARPPGTVDSGRRCCGGVTGDTYSAKPRGVAAGLWRRTSRFVGPVVATSSASSRDCAVTSASSTRNRVRPHGPCVRGEGGLWLDRVVRVATRPDPPRADGE